jgi:glycosyltransferase involved in cell wall biosynthesis
MGSATRPFSRVRKTRKRQKGGGEEHFRFHILAVPHTISRKDYSGCAYTENVVNFCKMMTARGHTVIHYGHEASQVAATEHVTVMRDADLKAAYGDFNWKRGLLPHRVGDLANTTINERAIKEVGARKRAGDILLLFWGQGHKTVAAAHPDLLAVDPGLGCFNKPATDHTVYVSYALQSHICGKFDRSPSSKDAVIPNYFDLADFSFSAEAAPKPYFLFLGRLIKSKGLEIAVEVAKHTGIPLKVGGQGDLEAVLGFKPPAGLVEHVGYLEPAERTRLLRGATALLVPSLYDEPFGKVIIEAGLCGTPVISSDWGGMTEIVLHGTTGYRCRTVEQFIEGAKAVLGGSIDRRACWNWATKNFGLERVAPIFEAYFKSLQGLKGAEGLNWLKKEYPCTK